MRKSKEDYNNAEVMRRKEDEELQMAINASLQSVPSIPSTESDGNSQEPDEFDAMISPGLRQTLGRNRSASPPQEVPKSSGQVRSLCLLFVVSTRGSSTSQPSHPCLPIKEPNPVPKTKADSSADTRDSSVRDRNDLTTRDFSALPSTLSMPSPGERKKDLKLKGESKLSHAFLEENEDRQRQSDLSQAGLIDAERPGFFERLKANYEDVLENQHTATSTPKRGHRGAKKALFSPVKTTVVQAAVQGQTNPSSCNVAARQSNFSSQRDAPTPNPKKRRSRSANHATVHKNATREQTSTRPRSESSSKTSARKQTVQNEATVNNADFLKMIGKVSGNMLNAFKDFLAYQKSQTNEESSTSTTPINITNNINANININLSGADGGASAATVKQSVPCKIIPAVGLKRPQKPATLTSLNCQTSNPAKNLPPSDSKTKFLSASAVIPVPGLFRRPRKSSTQTSQSLQTANPEDVASFNHVLSTLSYKISLIPPLQSCEIDPIKSTVTYKAKICGSIKKHIFSHSRTCQQGREDEEEEE